jgi:hypothetical protein
MVGMVGNVGEDARADLVEAAARPAAAPVFTNSRRLSFFPISL